MWPYFHSISCFQRFVHENKVQTKRHLCNNLWTHKTKAENIFSNKQTLIKSIAQKNQNTKQFLQAKNYVEHSRKVISEDPSLHLKESLESDFLRELGVSGLIGLLFSTAIALEVRQGKQLFGRIPQWSRDSFLSSPISSAWPVDTSPVKTESNSAQEPSDFNVESFGLPWFLATFKEELLRK